MNICNSLFSLFCMYQPTLDLTAMISINIPELKRLLLPRVICVSSNTSCHHLQVNNHIVIHNTLHMSCSLFSTAVRTSHFRAPGAQKDQSRLLCNPWIMFVGTSGRLATATPHLGTRVSRRDDVLQHRNSSHWIPNPSSSWLGKAYQTPMSRPPGTWIR